MVVKLALKRKNENIQIWSRHSLFQKHWLQLTSIVVCRLNWLNAIIAYHIFQSVNCLFTLAPWVFKHQTLWKLSVDISENIFPNTDIFMKWSDEIHKCEAALKRHERYISLIFTALNLPVWWTPSGIYGFWGSKWNLHTVCWSAVGCEWGTTSVYFGITYVCFIPSRLPVFDVEPQYLFQYFLFFVKSIIWITHKKSSKNFMLV